MKVASFVRLDVSGVMFRLVDADRIGYISNPYVLIEADKNVVKKEYGDYEVVGFENTTKKTIILYVKK